MFASFSFVLWSMALQLSRQIHVALNLLMMFFFKNDWFKALSTQLMSVDLCGS